MVPCLVTLTDIYTRRAVCQRQLYLAIAYAVKFSSCQRPWWPFVVQ